MSYRPITDTWILARAKLKGGRKYYGAYLGGFPERARALMGLTINQPMLHVCGGMAKHYPYDGGFGARDATLDLDPLTEPDFLQNALEPLPEGYDAHLCDPPYSEVDAANYRVGAAAYPSPNKLIHNCLDRLDRGMRVGILHYSIPQPKDRAKFIACVGVVCGFNNKIRAFSVFEKR
jgi:hypothetical protein